MSNEAIHSHKAGADFDAYSDLLRLNFDAAINQEGASSRLFRADIGRDAIYDAYLARLPENERQYHTCSCCRAFLRHCGNLVTIDDNGHTHSALWTDGMVVPAAYAEGAAFIGAMVENAPVRSVFLSRDKVLGTPQAGGFTHLWVENKVLFKDNHQTHKQAMALSREHHGTLSHGLADYGPDHIAQAVALLKADALYRSDKVLGPAEFLSNLHAEIGKKKGDARTNLIWRAIAGAPPNFCTPRGGMIGTLLEDIKDGLDADSTAARFKAKMHPLLYQRPQVAPRAGNIAMAEKLVAEMGLEPSLHRRWARFDEVETIWQPNEAVRRAMEAAPGGVFGHLQSHGRASQTIPAMNMAAKKITWVRFRETVLPAARKIEVLMENKNLNFVGTLTATNADAPPILQWDTEEHRNPISQYTYHGGSAANRWGLRPGDWVEVNGIMLHPSKWRGLDLHPNHGNHLATLILDNCRETIREPSLCLFPEILKGSLHAVRSTIEAYSKSRHPTGREDGSANGIRIGSEMESPTIRVTSMEGMTLVRMNYCIDRWE